MMQSSFASCEHKPKKMGGGDEASNPHHKPISMPLCCMHAKFIVYAYQIWQADKMHTPNFLLNWSVYDALLFGFVTSIIARVLEQLM